MSDSSISTKARLRLRAAAPLFAVLLVAALSSRGLAVCDVTFAVTKNATLGTLTFAVDYSRAGGEFRGSDTAVECTGLLAIDSFFAVDADNDFMTFSLNDAGGFNGPTDLARCVFDQDPGAADPTAGDFTYPSVIALEPGFPPVPVLVDDLVGVSQVVCTAGPTTTSTTMTVAHGLRRSPWGRHRGQRRAGRSMLTAVGAGACPACLCDVNDDGVVSATDALIVLRVAVGAGDRPSSARRASDRVLAPS